ncbi:MAG: tail fiber protein [Actinomycetota bacterium]|nr:tail fiber protein [Actinomycetota bacterium]
MCAASGVAALLVAGGTAAFASIPDSQTGVITGCYRAAGGLRVIDAEAGKACAANETQMTWNQTGPQGPAGPRGRVGAIGPQGPAGPAGPAGSVPGLGTDVGHGAVGNDDYCMLGEIKLSAGTVAMGLPADGRILQISQNEALFSLMGTTYGGDGHVTFAMPDMRAITPDHMTYSICDQGIYPAKR